jgi:hypothetical protein
VAEGGGGAGAAVADTVTAAGAGGGALPASSIGGARRRVRPSRDRGGGRSCCCRRHPARGSGERGEQRVIGVEECKEGRGGPCPSYIYFSLLLSDDAVCYATCTRALRCACGATPTRDSSSSPLLSESRGVAVRTIAEVFRSI